MHSRFRLLKLQCIECLPYFFQNMPNLYMPWIILVGSRHHGIFACIERNNNLQREWRCMVINILFAGRITFFLHMISPCAKHPEIEPLIKRYSVSYLLGPTLFTWILLNIKFNRSLVLMNHVHIFNNNMTSLLQLANVGRKMTQKFVWTLVVETNGFVITGISISIKISLKVWFYLYDNWYLIFSIWNNTSIYFIIN